MVVEPELPVLRDNFWLSVHVLTIVSSYAAFSLVMGLGLLGVAYYLSATYRRDVPHAAYHFLFQDRIMIAVARPVEGHVEYLRV